LEQIIPFDIQNLKITSYFYWQLRYRELYIPKCFVNDMIIETLVAYLTEKCRTIGTEKKRKSDVLLLSGWLYEIYSIHCW